jgi:putative NIF3 family GTP cyclohydrolase 1 type 2
MLQSRFQSALTFGFAALLFLLLPILPLRAQSGTSPTAAEAIARIVEATGATLPPNTVDTIKAGDPATPVTGIATTFSPTMEVLRQAVAAGDNLIVTHEPTFYNHLDNPAMFLDDPVYKEKLAYIQEHHLAIWRFHDTWHLRRPDGIAEGFVSQSGWKAYQNPGPAGEQGFLFTLPETTLQFLALDLKRRFHARAIRIVGDPSMKITKVGYVPGAAGEATQVKALERDDVQVIVVGEIPEWETILYARDAQLQGRKKALILLGHTLSEEAGMDTCAKWLGPLFPGMKIDFLPAGEPYWTPESVPTRPAIKKPPPISNPSH